MRLIFTSYSSSPEYSQPDLWLQRISGYTGMLENLSRHNTVIGIERINYEGQVRQKGVQYIFIKLKKKSVRFPFGMHRLIKRLRPDVVFVNGFVFPLQILQLRLKLGRKVKLFILHRAEKPFNGFRKHLQKLADKCVDGYLFTSLECGDEWIKEDIISHRRKVHEVIQASSPFQPVNRIKAKEEAGVSGAPVFLWVGRLDVNKDPITVVRAFIKFLSVRPSARLFMIFQSAELLDEITELIRKTSRATNNIHLVGQIPHQQLQTWYNSAEFILSGSHYEGSGVAVSEAMSCGCIPIITDIASFRRMTGPGKCGLLYPPGNHNGLLEALLLTDKLNLEQEREKVLNQFNDELSFDAISGKINRLLRTGNT